MQITCIQGYVSCLAADCPLTTASSMPPAFIMRKLKGKAIVMSDHLPKAAGPKRKSVTPPWHEASPVRVQAQRLQPLWLHGLQDACAMAYQAESQAKLLPHVLPLPAAHVQGIAQLRSSV